MSKQRLRSRSVFLMILGGAIASLVGCELAVDFDRSKIPADSTDAGALDGTVTTEGGGTDSGAVDGGAADSGAADSGAHDSGAVDSSFDSSFDGSFVDSSFDANDQ